MNAESWSRLASQAADRVREWRSVTKPPRALRTRPARLEVGAPIFGNLFALASDRLWVMEQASAIRGGICELPLAGRSVVVVSSPDLVHELLVTQADSFVKGTTFRFLRPIIGNGLLTSERDFHRRQRKLMAPALAYKRIAGYADTMSAFAERTQHAWPDGAHIDLSEEMMRLTLDVVTKTLLDADVGEDAADVGEAVSILVRAVNARISTPISFLLGSASRDPRVRGAIATLDGIILRIIRERRVSQTDTGDLLSMLLSAQEEGTGEGMSDAQVRDEVMTIFLAGHETTANALSWAMYLLARHPRAYERLRSEAVTVLGGRTPSASDIPRLGYALQVFKEALRLYPPAYLTSRLAVRDVEIGGHRIPKAGMSSPTSAACSAGRNTSPIRTASTPIASRRPPRRPSRGGLHPVRRRSPGVHRQQLRPDGGAAHLGDPRATGRADPHDSQARSVPSLSSRCAPGAGAHAGETPRSRGPSAG